MFDFGTVVSNFNTRHVKESMENLFESQEQIKELIQRAEEEGETKRLWKNRKFSFSVKCI